MLTTRTSLLAAAATAAAATAASAATLVPTSGVGDGTPVVVVTDDGVTGTFVAGDNDAGDVPVLVFDANGNGLGVTLAAGGNNDRLASDENEFLSISFTPDVFLDRLELAQASGTGENVTVAFDSTSFNFQPDAAAPLTGAPAGISVDPDNGTALLFDAGTFRLDAGDALSVTPNAGPNGEDTRLFFSSVSVTAVPEPTAAIALAGMGLLGLRRRK